MARPAKTEAQHAADAGVSLSTWRRRKKAAGMTPEAGDLREQKLAAEVRLRNAEADSKEKFLEFLHYEYLPRQTVAAQQAAIAHVVNALFRALPAELPSIIEGMSASDAEKKIRDWLPTWVDKIKAADDQLWVEAEAEVRRSTLKGDLKKVAEKQS